MTQNYNGLGIGRHRIMELPRATYAVYFSTTDAMLSEANKLHLKLTTEDAHAIDETSNVNFYSIRSNMGAPLVMLKVQDDAVIGVVAIGQNAPWILHVKLFRLLLQNDSVSKVIWHAQV